MRLWSIPDIELFFADFFAAGLADFFDDDFFEDRFFFAGFLGVI